MTEVNSGPERVKIRLEELTVVHNRAAQQFEISLGSSLAVVTYRVRDGQMIVGHTEVPPPYEGQGIAAKMTRVALNWARTENLLVVPRCPYTASFIAKHKEYRDLLAPAEP